MKKGNYTYPVIAFNVLVVDVMLASEVDNYGEYIWDKEGNS